MNNIKPTGFPVVMSLLMLAAVTSSAALAQVVEQFDFEPGQMLEIDLPTGGSIAIEGWDQPGIEISYVDERRGLDIYEILIENTAAGLSIESRLLERESNTNLQINIRAPRSLDLDFFSAGGSLELNGVTGEFSGKTGGGALRLFDVTGEADLRTGGGRIEVNDSELDGEIRTDGGKATVENVIGDLRVSSGGGAVTYRNVRSANGKVHGPGRQSLKDATDNTVLISNAGGKIRVTDAPEGASVSTGGGRVYVSGADRFVSAKTGGGDVEVEILSGWVNARTGAGEIDVTIEKNATDNGDVTLSSGTGDITLILPADFSMDLEVELGVTNNNDGKFTVTSDFDISIEKSNTWDYSRGSPRKYTYGSFIQNGGQHRVTITTTNGNVVIRKGS